MNCLYHNQKIKYKKRNAKILGFMADGRVAVQYNKMLIYADRNEIVRIPNV